MEGRKPGPGTSCRKRAMAACVSGASYAAARWLASRARAYGNSVCFTNEIGATVPSMSSTTAAGNAAAPRA